MTDRPRRRGYLDWMRGLAVVIMVGWHTLDSWTTPADKASPAFWYCMLIGGFGAPIFLFLAGVSVALASASRLRRADAGRMPGVCQANRPRESRSIGCRVDFGNPSNCSISIGRPKKVQRNRWWWSKGSSVACGCGRLAIDASCP